MRFLRQHLLEPVNALTHLVGAVASFAGLFLLLDLTWENGSKMLSMFIYGSSMVFLYAVSALLHGVKTTDENRMWLNRLDHMAIFLLIAGTYTPIAYNLFPDPWRWGVLITVWLIVLMGSSYKLFSTQIHGFLNTSIYIFLGWGSVLPLLLASNLLFSIPLRGLLLLLTGGLIYTIGFVVYWYRRPDPWPGRLGHHEIWHLFVLAGSLCHFLFIRIYVVPFERVA
jgi:hemolysin III